MFINSYFDIAVMCMSKNHNSSYFCRFVEFVELYLIGTLYVRRTPNGNVLFFQRNFSNTLDV